jgi:hypothetical protein
MPNVGPDEPLASWYGCNKMTGSSAISMQKVIKRNIIGRLSANNVLANQSLHHFFNHQACRCRYNALIIGRWHSIFLLHAAMQHGDNIVYHAPPGHPLHNQMIAA